MMQQLKESVETKNRFGVGFASSEAWDIMQSKVYTLSRCIVTVFERPFVKLFALCYRTVVLSVLSVCDVGLRPASNLSTTSFEPDSVMEFGFELVCDQLRAARSWSQTGSKPDSITLSWSQTGSKLVRSWSQTGSNQLRTCQRPASNLLRTSFEPDSVMEFGFKQVSEKEHKEFLTHL